MTEDDIDQTMEYIMRSLRPLIDDLAKQVGESPEAWRGIELVINGIGAIMMNLSDDGRTDKEQLLVSASIMAAINEHPALQAARRIYNKE